MKLRLTSAAGGRVVILARSPQRRDAAVAEIRRQVPTADLSTIPLDLADLDSVTSAAAPCRGWTASTG